MQNENQPEITQYQDPDWETSEMTYNKYEIFVEFIKMKILTGCPWTLDLQEILISYQKGTFNIDNYNSKEANFQNDIVFKEIKYIYENF
jgi:hypothetical protein